MAIPSLMKASANEYRPDDCSDQNHEEAGVEHSVVESAVNQLIDKRMSNSQQMRWNPRNTQLLLQVRVRVIDGQLRDDFARWYPEFPSNDSTQSLLA